MCIGTVMSCVDGWMGWREHRVMMRDVRGDDDGEFLTVNFS